MKVAVVPSGFKDWKTPREIIDIFVDSIVEFHTENGIPQPELDSVPISDGGEGTIDAIFNAIGGDYITVDNVVDPLGRRISSQYLSVPRSEKTAFIEMARASGLYLIEPEKRDPLISSSYGTGQLILNAYLAGHKRIVVGVGGAGSHDLGVGMAQALGVRFFDKEGIEIPLYMNNATIEKVGRWDLGQLVDQLINNAPVEVASDVDKVLLGNEGAAYTFGRQKGANDEQIEILERNSIILADMVEDNLKRFQESVYWNHLKAHEMGLGKNYRDIRGVAGGGAISYGLVAFLHARIKKGINVVSDLVNLESHMEDVDLVLTGEGRIDETTFTNKTVMGVAESALSVAYRQHREIPVIAVCGCSGPYDPLIARFYLKNIYTAFDRDVSLDRENGMNKVRQEGEIYLKAAVKRAFNDYYRAL